MKTPKISILLVFVLAASLLSAALVQGQENIELQVTWWGSQNRHDRTIQVIEMYEAENPNVDIVFEFANFNDYWTRLNTQAAGQLACIMQQDYAYVAEWANRDLLLPLDPFIESGAIDTTYISDSLLEGGRVNGEVYAISLGTNSQSIILDLDAFEAAGVELPAADWTWADFEEISTQLHDELGIWAIGPGLADVQLWKSLYVGLGENPFTDDGTALGYSDDQPLIDYYNMIVRLQQSGAAPTQEEALEYLDTGPENAPIVSGGSAMQYQWSNQLVAVWVASGEDRNLKLWHLPRSEGGAAENYLKPSQFFSITTSCPHPEEAANFINFFTNDLEANEILLAERGVPISTEVREHLLPLIDAPNVETFDFLSRVEADSSPIFPPDPQGFSDILNNVYTPLFVDPVLYGMIPVEEGVATLRTEAEAILAQNAS
ncbi:MAG: extracellular solute-binding protein [Burkholderiales bacterium]|nr:extracellular solute-binding protein [Anaerolineae bacterium]